MSRSSRLQTLEARLRLLESEFQAELVHALHACAAGKWGMFAQNERLYAELGEQTRTLMSSVEKDLLARATEIEHLREQLGYADPFPLAQRYREYREMRGPNVPGEPNLAKLFLQELGLT
jgi:hypothetical protein